jgi:hypothetical protein
VLIAVAIKKELALISFVHEKRVGFNILGEYALIFLALVTCPAFSNLPSMRNIRLGLNHYDYDSIFTNFKSRYREVINF